VLSVSLCGCSAFNDRGIYRNPVGPTVIGDGKSVMVSDAQNESEGQRQSTASDLEKAHGSIGWKGASIFRLPIPFVSMPFCKREPLGSAPREDDDEAFYCSRNSCIRCRCIGFNIGVSVSMSGPQ
jgi:hypothetical protein